MCEAKHQRRASAQNYWRTVPLRNRVVRVAEVGGQRDAKNLRRARYIVPLRGRP